VDRYEGAWCPTVGLDLSSILLKPGYWRVIKDSDELFHCDTSAAFCVGGNTSLSICSPGHYGPWCRLCESGWYLNPDDSCAKCGRINDRLVLGILAACVAGAAIMVVCVRALILRFTRIHLANNEDVWQALAAQNGGVDSEEEEEEEEEDGSGDGRGNDDEGIGQDADDSSDSSDTYGTDDMFPTDDESEDDTSIETSSQTSKGKNEDDNHDRAIKNGGDSDKVGASHNSGDDDGRLGHESSQSSLESRRSDEMISIPKSHRCPISLKLMRDPVVAADGHTYERANIHTWFLEGHTTSPVSGEMMRSIVLYPNHHVRSTILEAERERDHELSSRARVEAEAGESALDEAEGPVAAEEEQPGAIEGQASVGENSMAVSPAAADSPDEQSDDGSKNSRDSSTGTPGGGNKSPRDGSTGTPGADESGGGEDSNMAPYSDGDAAADDAPVEWSPEKAQKTPADNRQGDRVSATSVLKLTIIFLQLSTSLLEVYNASFPEPLASALYSLRWPLMDFPVDTIPFSCTSMGRPSFYVTLIMMTLGPLLLCGAKKAYLDHARKRYKRAGVLMYQEGQAMADAVFVLYLFQPLATRSAILTFICTDRFDDGSMSLLVDLSLSCDSTAHVMMTVYAALMIIIWPVGVTCVFFVLLCRDKVRNFSGRSSTDHVLNKISKGLNTYMEVKECDFGSLFAICDRDGDGVLSREDLLWTAHLLLPLTTPESALRETVDHLMARFGSRDRRGNEFIELDGLLAPGKLHFKYFNDPRRAGVKFLRRGYKEQYWFWEVVLCGVRLWLAAILLGIYRGDIKQFVTAMFFVFAMLIAQCYLNPSATFRGHIMALLSYLYLFWILIYGAFIRQNSLDNIVLCGYILFLWLLAILGYFLNSTRRGALRMSNWTRARRAVVPVIHLPLEGGEGEDGRTILQVDSSGHPQHNDGAEVEAEYGEDDRGADPGEIVGERGGQLARSSKGNEGDKHHAAIDEAAESGEESSGADEDTHAPDGQGPEAGVSDEDGDEREGSAIDDYQDQQEDDDTSSGYSSDEWIDFDFDI
jgi:hypothetical protein